jgi:hypothetical protein
MGEDKKRRFVGIVERTQFVAFTGTNSMVSAATVKANAILTRTSAAAIHEASRGHLRHRGPKRAGGHSPSAAASEGRGKTVGPGSMLQIENRSRNFMHDIRVAARVAVWATIGKAWKRAFAGLLIMKRGGV